MNVELFIQITTFKCIKLRQLHLRSSVSNGFEMEELDKYVGTNGKRRVKRDPTDPECLFGKPSYLCSEFPATNEKPPWKEPTRWDHPIPKPRAKDVPMKGKIIEAPHLR